VFSTEAKWMKLRSSIPHSTEMAFALGAVVAAEWIKDKKGTSE
jgi:hypothetical protein